MPEENTEIRGSYMESLHPQLKEFFISELSRYSASQLASYFIEGSLRNTNNEIVISYLPRETDNRRELVHSYLLGLPESFRRDFRRHLDYDVMFNLEDDPIFFPN